MLLTLNDDYRVEHANANNDLNTIIGVSKNTVN
jgi:hypothetical protein